MAKYSEKLKDPRWQRKRLEILQRDNFTCQCCFDTESTLHVHHRRYIPGIDPWDYQPEQLITLCESCHEYETTLMNSNCSDLTAIVKEKFLADGVYSIANGFNLMDIVCYDSRVIADVYGWALSDPNIQRELAERYFQKLKAENKKE